MNTRDRFGLAAGVVVLTALVGVLAAPDLPEQMVTDWNAAGDPIGTMPKGPALALIPVLSAFLLALFAVIPRIDPLRENIAEFRPYYDWFVVVFTAYLAIVQAGIVAFNLGYEFDFRVLIVGAMALLFYYIGFLLPHAKRNWFVGIRTPWTLSSPEVWDRTHALGGRLFKLAALACVVSLLFGEYAVWVVLVVVLGTAAVTVAYSYYLYERIERGRESDLEASP
jgi:uncharacterized membrane protein